MAFPIIPDDLKKLWDAWDIRVAVMASLFLQILLILIATLRKRMGGIFVTMFIWAVYLLADWVATFAIGLIANGPSDSGKSALNNDLMAFWAPFLLLHLGGPDTITAFSLEDNELWLRHMFQLVIHILLIAYVFSQSLPNSLWIPTTLVYLAGIIKYAERTRALYLASLGNFKNSILPPPSAGPNYARLVRFYKSNFGASGPMDIISATPPELETPASYLAEEKSSMVPSEDSHELVQSGYMFFNAFKGLLVDLTYGHPEWQKTREFFFGKNPKEAFRIIEIELNFLYDLLYTKMGVVHRKSGFFFRFVCLASIVLALERFVSHHKHHKHEIHEFDIYVTYALLVGAISLDILAILKLIFSDWTIVALENSKSKSAIIAIRNKLSFYENYRWSKSVSRHSLISYCLKERFKCIDKLVYFFGVNDFLDEIQYKETESVDDSLKEFIFRELREKARKAENSNTAKEICSWRGEKVLLQTHFCHPSLVRSVQVEYDESVLRWHVATELCYYETEGMDDSNKYRKFCKILSEYMLYLLVMRPTLMSAVAGILQIRFQDTCEEAKKFIRSEQEKLATNCFRCRPVQPMKPKLAREKLLLVDTAIAPDVLKGGTSRSVFFDACIMAKDLKNIDEKERWEMMSKVWVELLSYAASHCRANAHAQQLSKGGELITFVWLLMIHFGMGEQFQEDPRYLLIFAK